MMNSCEHHCIDENHYLEIKLYLFFNNLNKKEKSFLKQENVINICRGLNCLLLRCLCFWHLIDFV